MPESPQSGTFALHRTRTVAPNIDPVVKFQDHRTVLPASTRITWRLSLLALVVAKCRGQTASIPSLHLLMWGLRGRHAAHLLTAWLTGLTVPDLITSRVDPQLETTIRLAAAEGLVQVTTTGRVRLLERGKELSALIDADSEIMSLEKETLRGVAPISDSSLAKRMGGRFNDN